MAPPLYVANHKLPLLSSVISLMNAPPNCFCLMKWSFSLSYCNIPLDEPIQVCPVLSVYMEKMSLLSRENSEPVFS